MVIGLLVRLGSDELGSQFGLCDIVKTLKMSLVPMSQVLKREWVRNAPLKIVAWDESAKERCYMS